MPDMFSIVRNMVAPVLRVFWGVLASLGGGAAGAVLLALAFFFVRYPFWRKKDKPAFLEGLNIRFTPYNFLRWLIWDVLTRKQRKAYFNQYGFTIYVGRQGSGKTVSMVQYLEEQRKRFPKLKIVTNFKYSHADHIMKDWRDFLEIRNGTDGVIFAIDEIHSEYNAENWKDFPESLLSEISMQRKQRIKIVATAQVFSRVAKPIREQSFSVVCCDTYFGRLTFNREYDAAEYCTGDTPYMVRKKCRPISRRHFVQSNALRACYDTWEKVERMKKIEFLPRAQR